MDSNTFDVPECIKLSDEDIRIGINLELEAARAQARYQAIVDAAQMFAEQMRVKYDVDESYQMTDWLAGFEKVETGGET